MTEKNELRADVKIIHEHRNELLTPEEINEVVGGARLTLPELVETRFRYKNLKYHLPMGEAKELRWDVYLAQAQLQAILKALEVQLAKSQDVCPGWQGEECWYDKELKRYVVTGWDSNETCPTCKGTGKAQSQRTSATADEVKPDRVK